MGVEKKMRSLFDQIVMMLRQSDPEDIPEAIGELARVKIIAKTRLRLAPAVPNREPDGPPDRLILIPEVARILRISEHQARVMHRRGELPTLKVGKRVGMRQSALRLYLEQKERSAGH